MVTFRRALRTYSTCWIHFSHLDVTFNPFPTILYCNQHKLKNTKFHPQASHVHNTQRWFVPFFNNACVVGFGSGSESINWTWTLNEQVKSHQRQWFLPKEIHFVPPESKNRYKLTAKNVTVGSRGYCLSRQLAAITSPQVTMGEPGIEPGASDSESSALPLSYSPGWNVGQNINQSETCNKSQSRKFEDGLLIGPKYCWLPNVTMLLWNGILKQCKLFL